MEYAYAKNYAAQIIDTQGDLFERAPKYYPDINMWHFISSYMKSWLRKRLDQADPRPANMIPRELWNYYLDAYHFVPVEGNPFPGFPGWWIGRIYAYFQWYYAVPSDLLVDALPVDHLLVVYPGLHDLTLQGACIKLSRGVDLPELKKAWRGNGDGTVPREYWEKM